MDDQAAQARAALAGRADGGEEDAAHDEVEVCARGDDRGVVPAELEQRAPEAGGDARRDRLAHRGRAGRGDERDPIVVGELDGPVGAAEHELEEAVGDVAEPLGGAREQRRRRDRGERRPLGRLPDTGSPQTSASAAFQLHTATGKLNALITATGPSGCHVSVRRWPGRSEAIERP